MYGLVAFAISRRSTSASDTSPGDRPQESAISDHAYGRLALFADPFGNGFCLLQFNDRGYDAIATG